MRNLKANLLELIRGPLPSCRRRVPGRRRRRQGGAGGHTGAYAMDIVTKNIDLAKRKSQPSAGHGEHPVFCEDPRGLDRSPSGPPPRPRSVMPRPRAISGRIPWIR